MYRRERERARLINRHSFCDRRRYVAMVTNFRRQIGEIRIPTFIRYAGIPKELEYRNAKWVR